MLNDIEFTALCDRLKISPYARTHVDMARSSEPSRRVGGGSTNVPARYPSRKMGMVIQAESQLELSAIHLKEHDPGTLEYYDQPPVLKLTYEAPRNQRVLYTPDFFVVEQDGMGWGEWRPEDRLVRLAARYPERYRRNECGIWHFVPGERFAEPLGLFFRLRSSAEINRTLVRNLVMLQDYLREDAPTVADKIAELIGQQVKAEPGITLADLLQRAPADHVYRLIASGHLHTDLEAVALADPDRVRLFPDELTSEAYTRLSIVAVDTERPRGVAVEAGASVTWDGRPWRIVNVGQTCVALMSDEREVADLPFDFFERLVRSGSIMGGVMVTGDASSAIYDLLSSASAQELRKANDIFDLVRSGTGTETVPQRTLRRWKQQIREAELEHGRGYLGLLRRLRKGNRQPKLSPRSLLLMDEVIGQRYETLTQRRRRAVYGELARQCELEGVLCPSYMTFCTKVKLADHYRQTLKRRGPRAAYQVSEFVAYLDRGLARHGDRPFEVAHIDHTEADIEVLPFCKMISPPFAE